ncbi:MAG: glycosyltransferase [Syntrophobacteraceae bacterium]|nr:glycosyltransferase [Desulfobacteraceae bacterium]
MKPVISVIIPTWNRREQLLEAVASVLAQRCAEMEIIVVDDGSTDGTAEALESFGSRVACLYQPRAGVSAARNRGIEASRGEWLAFLDSDDLWLPEKLSAQMDFFSRHPEAGICQTEEVWIRNGRRLNPKNYHRKPEGRCFPLLLERCLVSPSAVMIHRNVFEEVGLFDESLPACEDYDLWLRIGCRMPIGLVKRPLVVKRGGHADQLSATVPALDRYRIRALEKILRSGALDAEQRQAAMDMLEHKCRIYGEGCRRRGREDEAGRVQALPLELAREFGRSPGEDAG